VSKHQKLIVFAVFHFYQVASCKFFKIEKNVIMQESLPLLKIKPFGISSFILAMPEFVLNYCSIWFID